MPGNSDEDFDWLYGHSRQPSEPEGTRILPAGGAGEADSAGPVTPRRALPERRPAPTERSGGARHPAGDESVTGERPLYRPSETERPSEGRRPSDDRRPPDDRRFGRAPLPESAQPVPPAYPAMPTYGQQQRWSADGIPPTYRGSYPPAPGPPPPTQTRRTKRRRPLIGPSRLVALLALMALLWLAGVPAYAWTHVGRVDASPVGASIADQPGKTFLLVGSDSREGLTKAERKRLGTGSTAGQRTDTIMLLHVPPSGQPALISIPRDSYVAIPKNGKNKINAAYAFGGPDLLVDTIQTNTGLRVDGYVEIGFGGFVNIIDALGGIRMCLPKAIKDADSHLDLPKGCQELGGVDALGYVRMRKADPRGDLGRVERQREMLAAIARKAASPPSIANPLTYWAMCNAATDGINVGEDTSPLHLARIAIAMRKISNGGGLTLTVPIANNNASTPVGSAVLWNSSKAEAMFNDLARGDTSKMSTYTK